LVERVKGPASFIAKMMIGAMLTMAASMLAFFGVIILEFWFLVKGEIKFSFSIFFAPIYAAFIIPIIFWVLDTILLLAGVGAVGGKVDLIGTMNIRAFSMAPIPLKLLYVFYTTKAISLLSLIGIPSGLISWVLTIWSILLLAKGIRKYFELGWGRSLIAALIPFLTKALIATLLSGSLI